MATGVLSWSQTADSNANADSVIAFPEGQTASSLNNSARGLMSVLAKWRDDLSGVQPSNAIATTAGSVNAMTLTTNGSISPAAFVNGWTLSFKVGAALANTGGCTLAVDNLAAKQVRTISGSNLVGGELAPGSVYTVTYRQAIDAWLLHRQPTVVPSGSVMVFFQSAAPSGWVKSTANTDKTLRVVSGQGGGTGGTTAFSSVFSGRTIANANLPATTLGYDLVADDHTHGAGTLTLADLSIINGVGVSRGPLSSKTAGLGGVNREFPSNTVTVSVASTATTGATGGATASLSGAINLAGSGTAWDFAVQYLDVIVCTKS